MVTCYLCKGKIRVTRDKHLFDEKLKKRYHLKCYAGICRVCDKPVYSKSKHKVIGSNVWHAECYKTAHRHNPATEEGVNRKLHQLSEELDKLRIGGRSGKRGATTEHGVTKKLHQLADELDKMRVGEKNPKYRTLKTPPPPPKLRTLKLPPPPLPFRKLKQKNPRRPTKEFWDKHYPVVLAQYKKKYPKKEAEERARKATAAIWYDTMGPKKKAGYEAIRRKREARENPTEEEFEKRLIETLDHDFLIFSMTNLPATKSVTVMSLRPTPVSKSTYSVDDTPEHRRLLDELGIEYTVLKISPEHAKLLVKQMLKRYRKNPTLVTPEQETDIVGAFQRVIHGIGTEADKLMVRMAREADVIMSTGPSVMVKRNPEEPLYNPKTDKVDYIIQDEFGRVFETGKLTTMEAEARALVYGEKHMRRFKVIYPKRESAEVKKAAENATEEMLKS